jgi:hypothetical protein
LIIPPVSHLTGSKMQPQRKRHDAAISRGGERAETAVHLGARLVEARRLVQGLELRMVEDVVGLHAELNRALLTQPDLLPQRHVPVIIAGTATNLAWLRARATPFSSFVAARRTMSYSCRRAARGSIRDARLAGT